MPRELVEGLMRFSTSRERSMEPAPPPPCLQLFQGTIAMINQWKNYLPNLTLTSKADNGWKGQGRLCDDLLLKVNSKAMDLQQAA